MQPSHFAFLLAATAASTVVAQLTPDQIAESIPECARACIKEAAPVVGCVETNYRCQCEKSAEMNSKAYPCLQEACEAEDLQSRFLFFSFSPSALSFSVGGFLDL